tara:strand:+ start:726 stop:1304 length:579 start_codon:yes stop_codon:yes gene_type:complete
MTFDKLADRCLLFIDERKQMLIELLKEAELEMTRKCNMYEDTKEFTCDGSASYGLPSNYKQMIHIKHDGDTLMPVSEADIYFNSDNDVDSGTPSVYYIRNFGVYLDTKPSSGNISMSYYGTVDGVQDTSSSPSPIIPSIYHRDLCDYAIAIASAKTNPELHIKHLQMWGISLEAIKGEDADRELIHSVRREI